MASSLKANSFDLSFENFMGRYRSFHNPQAVEDGKLSNTAVMKGGHMAGVVQHKLKLAPGKTIKFAVVIGAETNAADIPAVVAKYRNLKYVEQELQAVKTYWRNLILDNFSIQTPDKNLNHFTNVWNKYQVAMNNHWGRGVSFYHEGWGDFGYRNTAQDAMAMLMMDQAFAKKMLLKLAHHQRSSGQPLPGWSLIKGTDEGKPPSDFPMWLPMLLMRYVKETGEKEILDQMVDYWDGGSATLYQHAVQATRFLQDVAKSERGLPLMGSQDWNDAYDRVGIEGRGESIWLGMGLCFALKNLEELAAFKGDLHLAQEANQRYKKEKEIINRLAWDGNWYRYAYNDFGEPIGSKTNKEGAIQLNTQTWAIMAGIAEGERLTKVLKTIDEELDTPYGPVLFKPAYQKYDIRVGRICSFAPGTKENGAIFCHGGTFKVYADLHLHRGDKAYETMSHILPCAENKDIEIYKTEPYVFAEYLVGPENPKYGEGAHTWLTGSADWSLFCVLEGMLGVCPEFEGLKIDPCFPKKWKKAKMTRKFRGATYEIEISNPKGVEYGVKAITVDGQCLTGNIIPPHNDGRVHQVKVVMGN
jgi:cellobiose phosphorylase